MSDDTNDDEMRADDGAPTGGAIEWPSEAWREALRLQATPAVMARALRWAESEGVRVRLYQPGATWDAEDVVQHVLAGLLSGALTWRPERVSLAGRLRSAIREFGRRPRAAPPILDVADIEARDGADAEAIADGGERPRILRQLAERAEAQIAALAVGDDRALLVLSAMPAAETDDEIAEATGLRPAEVRAARRRLRRLALQVSGSLREDVRDTLQEGARDAGELARSWD